MGDNNKSTGFSDKSRVAIAKIIDWLTLFFTALIPVFYFLVYIPIQYNAHPERFTAITTEAGRQNLILLEMFITFPVYLLCAGVPYLISSRFIKNINDHEAYKKDIQVANNRNALFLIVGLFVDLASMYISNLITT